MLRQRKEFSTAGSKSAAEVCAGVCRAIATPPSARSARTANLDVALAIKTVAKNRTGRRARMAGVYIDYIIPLVVMVYISESLA